MKDANVTTEDNGKRREVSASVTDPDEALRVAIKAAVDVGDLDRARALLDVLATKPKGRFCG